MAVIWGHSGVARYLCDVGVTGGFDDVRIVPCTIQTLQAAGRSL